MTRTKHFHTIVIGAGPGGLTCATLLAEKGMDVLVVERNTSIGMKVCAGGVTWSGLARHLPEELIEKPFNRQYIHSGMQKTVIRETEPIISTINREKIGKWMADKALKAGVTLLSGTAVTQITDSEVVTKSGRYTFRYLVGADGSNSLVRRTLNIPTKRIGVGVHYQVPGNFPKMIWHLDPDLFKTGYAWVFPHSNSASVGAYANRADLSPKTLKEKLHNWIKKHDININGLKPEAATVNFDYRGWHFGNTFLVGDAAGLASGLTGEGIYPAVCSGETVAKTIIDPGYESKTFTGLIKKHRRHTRLLSLCSTNTFFAKIILESLIAALRFNIINFKALEMGD
ncbi:MAG: NAD(P)/FAD-dependent oxidoreductase [Desulfobulbaceae bacterium]|nr:NAD(P)/FAD-dependent oxidoreductase [Desulfobulbaceae bacterium]